MTRRMAKFAIQISSRALATLEFATNLQLQPPRVFHVQQLVEQMCGIQVGCVESVVAGRANYNHRRLNIYKCKVTQSCSGCRGVAVFVKHVRLSGQPDENSLDCFNQVN